MARITRSQWGARPPRPGPGRLDPRQVTGMVIHWPAMRQQLRGRKAVSAALREWQRYHMDDLGWSDIAYQEAIDQDGNVYVLRGLWRQSAANGNADVNDDNGAILLVLAPGEQPSAKMLKMLRKRIARHREVFPRSRKVYGHNDVRPEPTACPGKIVQDLIDKGVIK
jgi:hypothetical protein